jgi:hypothetical protein
MHALIAHMRNPTVKIIYSATQCTFMIFESVGHHSYCSKSATNFAHRPPCHPSIRSHSLLSPLPWLFPLNNFLCHSTHAASAISAKVIASLAMNFCPSVLLVDNDEFLAGDRNRSARNEAPWKGCASILTRVCSFV